MRVQRAVAIVLLSIIAAGCGPALRGGGASRPDLAWGLNQQPAQAAADPALDPVEGLVAGEGGSGGDAEAFLAGGPSLSHALDRASNHPKVVRRADEMQQEMGRGLRIGIARSGRYIDLIEREFEREGVPAELAYLPIIESGFSHDAVGGSAVGLWQFTARTAKSYGLIVNREVDERRDPEKATRAAAQLLRDLFDRFESWELAIAAYNAGDGRVEKALARSPGANFWQLADRSLLPRVTRDYVPKVLATALMASRPESFGLDDVDRFEPLRYDTFVVSQRIDVAQIASLCGRTSAEVKELNPALRSGVVPKTPDGFQLRLPEGTGPRFALNYAAWRGGRDGTPRRTSI